MFLAQVSVLGTRRLDEIWTLAACIDGACLEFRGEGALTEKVKRVFGSKEYLFRRTGCNLTLYCHEIHHKVSSLYGPLSRIAQLHLQNSVTQQDSLFQIWSSIFGSDSSCKTNRFSRLLKSASFCLDFQRLRNPRQRVQTVLLKPWKLSWCWCRRVFQHGQKPSERIWDWEQSRQQGIRERFSCSAQRAFSTLRINIYARFQHVPLHFCSLA